MKEKYDLKIYEMSTIDFITGSSNLPQCGGFTYQLNYMSGSMFDGRFPNNIDPSSVSVSLDEDGTSFTGILLDLRWEGEHLIRIKTYQGQPQVDPDTGLPIERGEGGMYNFVYSEPFTMKVVNPCRSTTLNRDGDLVVESLIKVPPGEEQEVKEY